MLKSMILEISYGDLVVKCANYCYERYCVK